MISFIVDETFPCLKKIDTGDIVETEVARVKRKSFLSHFNKRNGWEVNWNKFGLDVEIYALLLKGTTDVQGMIAISYDDNAKAVYLQWGCTSPNNNIWRYGKQEYAGVGGHLIAIASDMSERHGYDGFIVAEAIDNKLYNYYISKFSALPLPQIGSMNPYRFMLSDASTRKIREVYNYE